LRHFERYGRVMLVIESLIAEPMKAIPAQRKETIFVSALLALDSNRKVYLGLPKGVETLHRV